MKISPARAWLLFALLCAAGIFNAMDRPIIAILKPYMSAEFGWSARDFGRLAAVTQFAAACCCADRRARCSAKTPPPASSSR